MKRCFFFFFGFFLVFCPPERRKRCQRCPREEVQRQTAGLSQVSQRLLLLSGVLAFLFSCLSFSPISFCHRARLQVASRIRDNGEVVG